MRERLYAIGEPVEVRFYEHRWNMDILEVRAVWLAATTVYDAGYGVGVALADGTRRAMHPGDVRSAQRGAEDKSLPGRQNGS